ncbi:MAG TPA: hypothetical protein VGX03_23715 [Candidatus Binatia bacterium]|nr:hypothetical protein [Candidatus Binatia bacterium]
MNCRIWITLVLWFLGYPDQALARSYEAITLARETSHSFSLGFALDGAVWVHRLRREGQATQEQAEALMAFSREQGIYLWGEATMFRGWALSEQGQEEEGIAQIRQGLAPHPATESECVRPHFLGLLAEACGKAGQAKEGLALLDEALTATYRNVGRFYEAELYRLKGELSLQLRQVKANQNKSEASRSIAHQNVSISEAGTVGGAHPTGEDKAEACFLKAIEIARKQQAKSLELRAVMSLSRLWQQQGKKAEARQMLAEIYGWFTEGFDTKDLQEAKTLLEELTD